MLCRCHATDPHQGRWRRRRGSSTLVVVVAAETFSPPTPATGIDRVAFAPQLRVPGTQIQHGLHCFSAVRRYSARPKPASFFVLQHHTLLAWRRVLQARMAPPSTLTSLKPKLGRGIETTTHQTRRRDQKQWDSGGARHGWPPPDNFQTQHTPQRKEKGKLKGSCKQKCVKQKTVSVARIILGQTTHVFFCRG